MCGLRCVRLLSSGQVLPSECVSGLVELAGDPNTSPALTGTIISLVAQLGTLFCLCPGLPLYVQPAQYVRGGISSLSMEDFDLPYEIFEIFTMMYVCVRACVCVWVCVCVCNCLFPACDDESREVLHSSYNLTSTLASIIHCHSATPGQPLVLQVGEPG